MKPGTQTNTRVRLKGKGVPSLHNKQVRGDHYVNLIVKVPEKLTREQKEALLKYQELMEGKAAETVSEGKAGKKKGLFQDLKDKF